MINFRLIEVMKLKLLDKILVFINFIVTVFLLYYLVKFIILLNVNKTDADMASLGLFFIGILSLMILTFLFIPWLIILLKTNYKNMRLSLYSFVFIYILTILTLLLSFIFGFA